MVTIGVISDTHGKLTDSAIAALEGEYDSRQIINHVAIDAADEARDLKPAPCDLIVHAGDVGNASAPAQWILDRLQEVAPLIAVSGNCDYPDRYVLHGKPLPAYAAFEEGGLRFAVLHEPQDLRAAVKGGLTNPAYITPEPRVQIHGHTHVQRISIAPRGTVTICPGSIALPKEGNPPTVAILKVDGPGMLLSVDIVAVQRLCPRPAPESRGQESPLSAATERNRDFFDLFVDFDGYVEFFYLQDCIDPATGGVRIWLGNGKFAEDPWPASVSEYLRWIESQLEFVEARNERIRRAVSAAQV